MRVSISPLMHLNGFQLRPCYHKMLKLIKNFDFSKYVLLIKSEKYSISLFDGWNRYNTHL